MLEFVRLLYEIRAGFMEQFCFIFQEVYIQIFGVVEIVDCIYCLKLFDIFFEVLLNEVVEKDCLL